MVKKKLKDHSLFDELELRGRWGLNEEELNVIGSLNYSQNKIELDLVGTLKPVDHSLIGAFTQDDSSFLTIYGIAESGERISLLNCAKTNSTTRFNGISVEKYEVDDAIVGTEFINNNYKFKFITFSTNDLGIWSGINRINNDHIMSQENDQVFSQTVDLAKIKQNLLEWPIEKFGTILKENYMLNISGTEERNQIYNYKFLFQYELTRDQEMESLDWFVQKIYSLKSLLTLLIGAPLFFDNINIYGDYLDKEQNGKQYRKKFKVLHRQHGSYNEMKLKRSKILLTLPEIKDFSSLISLWFEKENDLRVLVDFINGDHYNSMSAENVFLNIAQTAEIFHRRFSGEKLMTTEEKDDYLSKRTKLIEYLDLEFDKDFATLIKNRISNPDAFSLKDRLTSLISKLDLKTIRTFIGDTNEVKSFIKNIGDRRNYLTHLDEERYKDKIKSSDIDLILDTHRLKVIMIIHVLSVLNVQEVDSFNKLQSIYSYLKK
ncbi:HEPN domain-containing protein [Jeotgalibacillus proteolyticus]|uniref:Uncharacterized protein n=1 Tax=Jeotgalibacillus proteolyticus TaxID=2082395 RepID=A0A2S5GFM7_9BACL|nr:HEPN domain-containing protein [Jeotgalibacillus proteolyticus]PPA71806.1 hypothetical protein C4B60_00040 [Jeotgalibacillus proteolyticus]